MAGRASIEVREPIPGLKRAGRLFRDYYGFDIVMPANFRAVEIVLKSYFDPWRMSGVRGKAFRPAKNSVQTPKKSQCLSLAWAGQNATTTQEFGKSQQLLCEKTAAFLRNFQSLSFEDTVRMVMGKAMQRRSGTYKRSESFRSLRGPTSGSPLDRSTSGNQLSKRATVTVVYWHFNAFQTYAIRCNIASNSPASKRRQGS